MSDLASDPSSLLSQLRMATRHDHVRLEQLLGLPDSIEEHIARLKNFYGFSAMWEPKALSLLSMLQPLIEERQKLSMLEADLLRLGLTAAEVGALPLCSQLPLMDDQATALGSMYVMEGSTLGGQIISRHLEGKLGLRDGEGYAYYQSYGAAVGRMWKAFLQMMQHHIEPAEASRLVDAARQTFRCLHQWFSRDL